MSTQVNNYIILGAKYGYGEFYEQVMKHNNIIRPEGVKPHISDEWRSKAFDIAEPFIDNPFAGISHHKGLCVLGDGMSAKYVIVGRVIFKSGNHESLDDTPLCCSKITDMERELISGAITANFGFDEPEIHVWALAHYR